MMPSRMKILRRALRVLDKMQDAISWLVRRLESKQDEIADKRFGR
jgi:hypothetical protein